MIQGIVFGFSTGSHAIALIENMPPHKAVLIKTLKPRFGRRRHIFTAYQVDVSLRHQACLIINTLIRFLQQNVRLNPAAFAEHSFAIHIVDTAVLNLSFVPVNLNSVQPNLNFTDAKVELFCIGYFSTCII